MCLQQATGTYDFHVKIKCLEYTYQCRRGDVCLSRIIISIKRLGSLTQFHILENDGPAGGNLTIFHQSALAFHLKTGVVSNPEIELYNSEPTEIDKSIF